MKLELKNINKYFDDFHVLQDIDFTINSGEIFGYLGRNGAGKTTSIRILMDVFEQSSGEILVDGKKFDRKDYKIGYLPEERGMYSKVIVKDQLIYFAMLRGATKAEAIKSMEYWTKRFEISEYLNRKVETLSKGNQQKVQIAQAFINEPDILILDEPFSGLDPVNSKVFQDALIDYINDERIIIFSSHQMTYVESFCDSIAIIDKGRIVLEGSLSKIKHEMGDDAYRVAFEGLNPEESLELVGVEGRFDDKSAIVNLPENMESQGFVADLLKLSSPLALFSRYEPSLQDIFIEKVGGNHETV